jgi:hypothetical protein
MDKLDSVNESLSRINNNLDEVIRLANEILKSFAKTQEKLK